VAGHLVARVIGAVDLVVGEGAALVAAVPLAVVAPQGGGREFNATIWDGFYKISRLEGGT